MSGSFFPLNPGQKQSSAVINRFIALTDALLGNVLDPLLLPYFDPLCDSAAMRIKETQRTWHYIIIINDNNLFTRNTLYHS